MRPRYFYGWTVVGATFVMAMFSFGLGFYGLTVYLASLQRLHGWSASTVSAPVTVYYVAGALLTAATSGLYERLGPRTVVIGRGHPVGSRAAAPRTRPRPWAPSPALPPRSVGRGGRDGPGPHP